MGVLQDNYGLQMLHNTPPGSCPECATAHEPYMPHNRDSLYYQYQYYDKHGKWPTWADAMAHCSQRIKELWIEELMVCGIDIGGSSETAILEVDLKHVDK